MLRIVILAASLILFSLTSCPASDSASPNGGTQGSGENSESSDDARAAVDTYIEAVRTVDGEVGCTTLRSDAQDQLTLYNQSAEAADDCAAAFSEFSEAVASEREEELKKIESGEVELAEDGKTASSSLTYPENSGAGEGRYVSLKQEGGNWLLDDIYEP